MYPTPTAPSRRPTDLSQDTFVRLTTHKGSVEKPNAYAAVVRRNLTHDACRRLAREQPVVDFEATHEARGTLWHTATIDAERAADQQRAVQALMALRGHVLDEHLEAFTRHVLLGESAQEVAEALQQEGYLAAFGLPITDTVVRKWCSKLEAPSTGTNSSTGVHSPVATSTR